MDKHEAERKRAEGAALLEQLGDVPLAYGFACELPAAHGEPLEDLDRLWYDQFEAVDREWMVVLNGKDVPAAIETVGTVLEGGAALVLCDGTVLARITPVNVHWYVDPDTEDSISGETDHLYWDDQVIEALHTRLREKGKEVPDLQRLVRERD